MRTTPPRVVKVTARSPGLPSGATQFSSTSSTTRLGGASSQSATRDGSPAMSRESRATPLSQIAAGCSARVGLPLDEERQLGIGLKSLDTDLPPPKLDPVRAVPAADHRLTLETLLDQGDVIDGDDPAEPTPARLRTRPYGLTEGRLVGRRVVEHLDQLHVLAARQRQHHVAGAEPGVHATVDERRTEQLRETTGRPGQSVGTDRVRDMVETHGHILPCQITHTVGGVRGVRDVPSFVTNRPRGQRSGVSPPPDPPAGRRGGLSAGRPSPPDGARASFGCARTRGSAGPAPGRRPRPSAQ